MRTTLFIFVFFTFQASIAASASEDYSTPEKTVAAYADAISPSVKTLDHDIFVYHYRPRKSSESISVLSEKAAAIYTNYVRQTIYGKPLVHKQWNAMGPGLYVAIDPLASRDYGGNNFVLFQIRMAKGSRYWDITDYGPHIDTELRRAAETHFGCSDHPSEIASGGNGRCHLLRQRILRRLGISAIAYRWTSFTAPRDLCPHAPNLAMVLTNITPFRQEDIKVFAKSWFPFAGPDKTNRRMLQWLTHFSPQRSVYKLWPALNPRWPTTDEEVSSTTHEWAKKNLLGCE